MTTNRNRAFPQWPGGSCEVMESLSKSTEGIGRMKKKKNPIVSNLRLLFMVRLTFSVASGQIIGRNCFKS